MSNTVTALRQKVAQQRDELAKLEAQLEQAESEPTDYQLARELHDLTCGWNHTDGCSWFYEPEVGKDAWTGYAHSRYLGRARKLMVACEHQKITVEQAINNYKLIKGL